MANFLEYLEKAKQIVADHRAEYNGIYYMKDGGWNPIRDLAESAASLTGNYLLPGSSLVSDQIVSKGSQNQLNSPLGKIAQIATGLTGSGVGSDFTGIPSASDVGAGWTNAANAAGNAVGAGDVGTNVSNYASNLYDKAGRGLSSVLSGVGLSNPSMTEGDANFLQTAKDASQGLSPGESSFLATARSGLSPLSTALSGGVSSGSGSSALPLISSLAGGGESIYANNQAQKNLTDAENKALAQLAPFNATGVAANKKLSDLLGTSGNTGAAGYGSLTTPFSADNLENDPGYKFELGQLNKSLDRQAAAKGNYFSGAALKEAQDYGKGLADTTLNNAFSRYLSGNQAIYGNLAGQSGQGANVATAAGNAYTGIGNAKAASNIATGNTINSTLSSILSGSGAKRPYNINGQTYYF